MASPLSSPAEEETSTSDIDRAQQLFLLSEGEQRPCGKKNTLKVCKLFFFLQPQKTDCHLLRKIYEAAFK